MGIENLKQFISGVAEASDLADDVYSDEKINLKDIGSVIRIPGIIENVINVSDAWKEAGNLSDDEFNEVVQFIKDECDLHRTDSESDKLTDYLEKVLIAGMHLAKGVALFNGTGPDEDPPED